MWGVSRPTVRQGIQELVNRGMLVRRRGIGTQVVASQVKRRAQLTSLWDQLVASGHRPSTIVRRLETIPAEEEVARALDIETGTPVTALERVRLAGTEPLAIMKNWLAPDDRLQFTTGDLEAQSLYALLRRRGIQPQIARQMIGAKTATTEEAETLGLAVGAPLVTVRLVMQDRSGATIEVGSHVYDATRYVVESTVVAGT
jgi:DNA-binding GntR family transcriptional regulator